MRHLRTIAAFLTMFCIVVGSVQAQAGSPGIKVNVPFRFAIQRTVLSSGVYSIFAIRDKIWVQEAGGQNVAVLLTSTLDGRVPDQAGRVIFDCYSGECFLSQIWIAGEDAGRSLPKSKRQVELASKDVGQQFSLLGKPQR